VLYWVAVHVLLAATLRVRYREPFAVPSVACGGLGGVRMPIIRQQEHGAAVFLAPQSRGGGHTAQSWDITKPPLRLTRATFRLFSRQQSST
jgi:hypothetical protein